MKMRAIPILTSRLLEVSEEKLVIPPAALCSMVSCYTQSNEHTS